MRSPSHLATGERRLDVKMTPMIDVVFLLLIFFVCTASFQTVEEVLPSQILLSGAAASDMPLEPEEDELEDVIIALRLRDGQAQWVVNEQTFTQLNQLRELLDRLVAIQPRLPVILDVGGDVPLGQAIDLYDLCRLLGYQEIRFAAEAPS